MQDLDRAHRKGHIFEYDGQWHCTSHGNALQRREGMLYSPCCGLEVALPAEASTA